MKYAVVSSKQFKRQYRQIKFSGRKKLLDKLDRTIDILSNGDTLPLSNHNHKLTGELVGFFECHIEPDWLLIYKVNKNELVLMLFATGSHATLF